MCALVRACESLRQRMGRSKRLLHAAEQTTHLTLLASFPPPPPVHLWLAVVFRVCASIVFLLCFFIVVALFFAAAAAAAAAVVGATTTTAAAGAAATAAPASSVGPSRRRRRRRRRRCCADGANSVEHLDGIEEEAASHVVVPRHLLQATDFVQQSGFVVGARRPHLRAAADTDRDGRRRRIR